MKVLRALYMYETYIAGQEKYVPNCTLQGNKMDLIQEINLTVTEQSTVAK